MNSQEVKSLVLMNDGNCTLYYRLVLEQHRPKGLNNDPCGTEAWAGSGAREGFVHVSVCLCVLKIDGPYMVWVRQDS